MHICFSWGRWTFCDRDKWAWHVNSFSNNTLPTLINKIVFQLKPTFETVCLGLFLLLLFYFIQSTAIIKSEVNLCLFVRGKDAGAPLNYNKSEMSVFFFNFLEWLLDIIHFKEWSRVMARSLQRTWKRIASVSFALCSLVSSHKPFGGCFRIYHL